MSAPRNGGTRPSNVAIATSHGSSIRRRASLYTQYATASQKTTPKKISRLRMTCHVCDSNHEAPRTSAVTGEAFRSCIRRRTRSRRTLRRRTPRTARRSNPDRTGCSCYVCSADGGEVREQVERAGHENGRAERVAARDSSVGLRHDLDVLEVPPRPSSELVGRQRSGVRGPGGHEDVCVPREQREYRVDVLVGEDRRHDRAQRRQLRLDEPNRLRRMRTVPELVLAVPV